MADNTTYTPGSGATIGADDIAGVLHQRVKLTHGVDGVAVDASGTNPLPVAAEGDVAHDAADSGNPVKIGGKAFDYEAMPTDVAVGDRVDAAYTPKGVAAVALFNPETSGPLATLPVMVTTEVSLAAGDNNIGNVDVVSSALPTGAATSANQSTIIGHVDGIEGLLGTIDADTGGILTSVQLLDNAISGSEMQVDVVTMPAVTIDAGSLGTQYTEDAALGGTGTGTLVVARRDDALSTLTPVADDAVGLRVGDKGALWVQIADGSGAQITSFGGGAGDTAHDAVDSGNPVKVGGYASTSAPAAVAAGDRVNAWLSPNGAQGSFLANISGSLVQVAQPSDTETNTNVQLFTEAHGMVFNGTTWDRVRGDITNGIDVDVTRLPALVAGSANIGDVDVASIAAGDNNIGNVDVVSLPGVAGDVAHDAVDSGNPIKMGGVANASAPTPVANGDRANAWMNLYGAQAVMLVDPSGTSDPIIQAKAIGPALHDGAFTPGAQKPALTGGRASAAAPTNVSADDDAVYDWNLRSGAKVVQLSTAGALIGGDAANGLDVDVTRLPALVAGTANIGDVDVLSLPAIPAGTNNIGDVDVLTLPNVTLAAGTNTNEVVGDVAEDAALAGNPVRQGVRASTAIPTAMNADGDVVTPWANRNGAQVVAAAPHVGLNSDPWNLVHEAAQYTTAQTSAVLVAGGASEKIVVTKVQIQAGGTVAGTVILYFGTGAYSRGTSRAIFDGEFAPSATSKPGVVMDGPFIAGTNGDDLMVTTTNSQNPLTISCWYYVVT